MAVPHRNACQRLRRYELDSGAMVGNGPTANQLPINTLTAGMTPSVDYQGTININARVFAAAQDPVQGTVRLELADAQLSHKLLSHRVEHTTLGSGTVSITATKSALNAEAALEDGEVGTIKAKFAALRGAPQWQHMPLQGEIHAQTAELNLISLYMPDIDRAAGQLAVDVQIAGTLGTPLVNGEVKVADAEVDFYQVNLGLRQLGLEAKLTDNGLNFSGTARVGSGIAHGGRSSRMAGFATAREVQPERREPACRGRPPRRRSTPSPDLEFAVDGRKIEVTGEVKVPNAKIEPKDLTGAVRASSDEVIVGNEANDPAKRFEVVSTIKMTLGDQVSIQTSGLTGRPHRKTSRSAADTRRLRVPRANFPSRKASNALMHITSTSSAATHLHRWCGGRSGHRYSCDQKVSGRHSGCERTRYPCCSLDCRSSPNPRWHSRRSFRCCYPGRSPRRSRGRTVRVTRL